MSYETIRLRIDDARVARLTLARGERHNALDGVMIRELTAAAHALAGETGLRALVIDAESPSFCAGGDLAWMKGQFAADRAGKIGEARALAAMLEAVDELPLLTIAAVHGPAYGGGVGLIAVCDVAVAADGARFALTETRLGLVPATIGPHILRRMGEANVRRLALGAVPFDAAEALRVGLVDAVVPAADLAAAVEREVEAALACAPGAIAAAKALFRGLARPGALRPDPIEALADRWESEEARAGIAAFFDRRDPPWKA